MSCVNVDDFLFSSAGVFGWEMIESQLGVYIVCVLTVRVVTAQQAEYWTRIHKVNTVWALLGIHVVFIQFEAELARVNTESLMVNGSEGMTWIESAWMGPVRRLVLGLVVS